MVFVEHPRQSKLTEELVVSHVVKALYFLKPVGGTLRLHVRGFIAIEFSTIIIQIGEYLQTSFAIFQVCLFHTHKIVTVTILGTKCSTKAFALRWFGANADD